MKINNKGYASTIIMFSILALFLLSMLMLVKTMNNSSSLNKKITEKVVDNIDYDASGTVQNQIFELNTKITSMQNEITSLKEDNKNLSSKITEMNDQLNNKDYIKPTISNSNIIIYNGGYIKQGNKVIVNIEFAVNKSNISKDVNLPTEIFKNFPRPIDGYYPTLYSYTLKADGSGNSVKPLYTRILQTGTMIMTDSDTIPINAGWSIFVTGTYITKEGVNCRCKNRIVYSYFL